MYICQWGGETLNFFFRKLDLAKTVWALRILSQKSTRNFGIKELWAQEKHALVNMLLCSSHFAVVKCSKLSASLFHATIFDFVHKFDFAIAIFKNQYTWKSAFFFFFYFTFWEENLLIDFLPNDTLLAKDVKQNLLSTCFAFTLLRPIWTRQ